MLLYGVSAGLPPDGVRKGRGRSNLIWRGCWACAKHHRAEMRPDPIHRSLIVTTDASRKSLSGPAYSKEPVSLFGLNGRFFAPAWAQKGAARRGCQDGPEAHAKRLGLDSPEHGAMLTAGWGIHNSGARFPLSFPALGSWFFPGSAKAAATWLPGPVPLCPGRDHP